MRKVVDWIFTLGLFWPLVGLSVVVILPLTIVEGVWVRRHELLADLVRWLDEKAPS